MSIVATHAWCCSVVWYLLQQRRLLATFSVISRCFLLALAINRCIGLLFSWALVYSDGTPSLAVATAGAVLPCWMSVVQSSEADVEWPSDRSIIEIHSSLSDHSFQSISAAVSTVRLWPKPCVHCGSARWPLRQQHSGLRTAQMRSSHSGTESMQCARVATVALSDPQLHH